LRLFFAVFVLYILIMTRFFLLSALMLMMILPLPAAAQNQGGERPVSVVRAEQYLRGLNTATARFMQTAHNGHQAVGTFYLDRPGRLRFEYDDAEDFIVADGSFIFFYDSELGEQSNAPIGQTLADFILRPDLRLGGDVQVSNVNRHGGLLQITLVQARDPGAGSLTLGFIEQPEMALKRWRVTDATGAITEIELFDLQTGMDLPRRLFAYHNPRPRGYNE